MVKIALLGLIAAIAAVQFKGRRPEYGLYISISACLIIFAMGVTKIKSIMAIVDKLEGYISISPTFIAILLKMIGITYIAEFSASLCKDAGHDALSNQISIVGKLTILSMSMPIILSLLDTISDFLA
ncbi:stage III sporulation AC/AD family protein [[Clostridium] polysaccharolyticum]|jgi:stage III sporulation protein AD|uniref:Stage III sporulation protein AD n=1 Tax=[Clostridium] polysaccharolyticum TaxID=29364 RepID=A0A1H9ZZU0_9FIRM|nr:stage III sporulation AC/AD family protein [[Clostridium] polysaccharolyticum]SES87178.1 stage III sporulation protein AD [[Clostridium] polysaccharolyticum]